MFATPPKRQRSNRSTEAPMDFQFTSRPTNEAKPAWTFSEDERKRSRQDSEPPAFHPASPMPPTFGANHNVPFIFNTPPHQTPSMQTWTPPTNFSADQAFPHQELHDIDMTEGDPVKPEDVGRPVASGALQRVFKSRQQSKDVRRRQIPRSVLTEEENDTDDEGDDQVATPITQTTSHHYTLNMPSTPAPQSDMPYILLGYLQFFFNLSLVLLFLYLLVQFIITIQRDVEQRISEHSLDISQHIAMCAVSYTNNNCGNNRIPHMIQPCSDWEACMNRDPTIVGRARVGAEMIGEIVNSFVESISWKTLLFSLSSLAFLTVFINTLLSLYRSRLMPAAPPLPPHLPNLGPPPPGYHASPFHPNFNGYIQPGSTGGDWSKPSPRWPQHDADEAESPTRRRKLDRGDSLRLK